MITTYRTQAEKILTTYYRGIRAQESNFSLRHVAQLISEELAYFAGVNAGQNRQAGETFYSNDTFIATFKNIAIQTDSVLLTKFIPLPSIPTALPSNQEIQKVWPVGGRKIQIIPIPNRSKFSQDLLPPIKGKVLYYIEDGNIVFNNPTMFDFPAVNINLIGAMPDGYLLDQTLLLPKNFEGELSSRVIQRLELTAHKKPDLINDAVPED